MLWPLLALAALSGSAPLPAVPVEPPDRRVGTLPKPVAPVRHATPEVDSRPVQAHPRNWKGDGFDYERLAKAEARRERVGQRRLGECLSGGWLRFDAIRL